MSAAAEGSDKRLLTWLLRSRQSRNAYLHDALQTVIQVKVFREVKVIGFGTQSSHLFVSTYSTSGVVADPAEKYC